MLPFLAPCHLLGLLMPSFAYLLSLHLVVCHCCLPFVTDKLAQDGINSRRTFRRLGTAPKAVRYQQPSVSESD
ncbi:hypothetical protein GGR57DRAFT_285542 [Xylariaceae sp. FL1272]|nr:hypothetical protein GGR57DRAFT_285542 [Xylariaceae sp. FL1272]